MNEILQCRCALFVVFFRLAVSGRAPWTPSLQYPQRKFHLSNGRLLEHNCLPERLHAALRRTEGGHFSISKTNPGAFLNALLPLASENSYCTLHLLVRSPFRNAGGC